MTKSAEPFSRLVSPAVTPIVFTMPRTPFARARWAPGVGRRSWPDAGELQGLGAVELADDLVGRQVVLAEAAEEVVVAEPGQRVAVRRRHREADRAVGVEGQRRRRQGRRCRARPADRR